ncbi:3'-5' exoribonuclease 1 [Mortierella sp. GBA30]|nr:3'-5' exoribonuclease 1 [Mortierella sp. GBA30]
MTTADDVRERLRELGLDTRGNKTVIKERLRKHLKKNPTVSSPSSSVLKNKSNDDGVKDDEGKKEVSTVVESEISKTCDQDLAQDLDFDPKKQLHRNSQYDYYLCFDVEATCEKGFAFEFPNEVIEFPVVLLDGSTLEVETIDEAPTFTEVLALFEDWLMKHKIILGEYTPIKISNNTTNSKKQKQKKFNKNNNNKHPLYHQQSAAASNDFSYGATFCFVTDGPFDIRDFIGKQCLHSGIARPSYFVQSYIDVRTLFRNFFDLIQWQNLEGMLKFLGETFEGRQHSGICDARMVALIAQRLAQGFSQDLEKDAPIFREENLPYVAPQWSDKKIEKFRAGCTLKANRSTDQTFVKMMSFKRLEKIEALPALVAAGAAMMPPRVPKSVKDEEEKEKEKENVIEQDAQGTIDMSSSSSSSSLLKDETLHDEESSSPPLSKISSPASSPLSSPIRESFVTESKYAALMTEPE